MLYGGLWNVTRQYSGVTRVSRTWSGADVADCGEAACRAVLSPAMAEPVDERPATISAAVRRCSFMRATSSGWLSTVCALVAKYRIPGVRQLLFRFLHECLRLCAAGRPPRVECGVGSLCEEVLGGG